MTMQVEMTTEPSAHLTFGFVPAAELRLNAETAARRSIKNAMAADSDKAKADMANVAEAAAALNEMIAAEWRGTVKGNISAYMDAMETGVNGLGGPEAPGAEALIDQMCNITRTAGAMAGFPLMHLSALVSLIANPDAPDFSVADAIKRDLTKLEQGLPTQAERATLGATKH